MKPAAGLAVIALLLVGAAPANETGHVVRAGETLRTIAARAGVSEEAIAEANRLRPPYRIRRGQRLVIPRARRHRVAAGETAFAIAWRHAVPWEAIAATNGLSPAAPLRPGQELVIPVPGPPRPAQSPTRSSRDGEPATRFAWPVEGQLRRGYAGGRRKHDGIDIVAEAGAPVRAAAAGRVMFAGVEPQQFGNLVVVDHGRGWHSAYAHLGRITVREGARVRAGQRLGQVGRTGRTTRDELHFELRRHNRPVDPAPLLGTPR